MKTPIRTTSAAVLVTLCLTATASAATLETCNVPRAPAQLTACHLALEPGSSLAIYQQWVSTASTKPGVPVQVALVAIDAKGAVVGTSYEQGGTMAQSVEATFGLSYAPTWNPATFRCALTVAALRDGSQWHATWFLPPTTAADRVSAMPPPSKDFVCTSSEFDNTPN